MLPTHINPSSCSVRTSNNWIKGIVYKHLDQSSLTSLAFLGRAGTTGKETIFFGWYRPVLNTHFCSLSRFSFSRALRSFQRSSCFSLSSTAKSVENHGKVIKVRLFCYRHAQLFRHELKQRKNEALLLADLVCVLSWIVDMLATAIDASRVDISISGSLSSCLRVFTARSRFSFWDWDLLRDILTLNIDTLVSRWRRWAKRDSMVTGARREDQVGTG